MKVDPEILHSLLCIHRCVLDGADVEGDVIGMAFGFADRNNQRVLFLVID